MTWTMPAPPNQLIQLLRRQSPMAPAVGAPPPNAAQPVPPQAGQMQFGPQPTPQTVAQNQLEEGSTSNQPLQPNLGQPGGRPLRPAPEPQPNPAAPPSDDPSISPVQRPPDVSSYLSPAMQRMNDLMARRAAVPGIDPNQVKPKWWERALGVALGATQLRDPENAANVADMVVHRRLYSAERARNLALQPIDEQIKAEREAFPLYTAAGEAAYRQAQLGVDTNRENRERYTAKSNAGYKNDWNQIRQQAADDRQKAAQDRIQQQQDQLTERERSDQGLNEIRKGNLDVRQQLADLKGKDGEKRGTPGQFSQVEIKKQQALSKAHSDYQKAVTNLDPKDLEGHKQAADDLVSAQQQAQDAYEQEIIALGGTAQHFDYSSQGKARPSNSAPAQGEAEKVNELGGRKVGDIGVVRGRRVRITAIYKNGKFDYEPAAGTQ